MEGSTGHVSLDNLEDEMRGMFGDETVIRNQVEAAVFYRVCILFAYQKRLRLEPLAAVIEARWSKAGLANIKRLAR
jgi:hypothetical protein